MPAPGARTSSRAWRRRLTSDGSGSGAYFASVSGEMLERPWPEYAPALGAAEAAALGGGAGAVESAADGGGGGGVGCLAGSSGSQPTRPARSAVRATTESEQQAWER